MKKFVVQKSLNEAFLLRYLIEKARGERSGVYERNYKKRFKENRQLGF